MGESSAELKHEVEDARAALARDVDLLSTKASPHRIAGRGVSGARSGLHRLADRIRGGGRAVRDKLRRH